MTPNPTPWGFLSFSTTLIGYFVLFLLDSLVLKFKFCFRKLLELVQIKILLCIGGEYVMGLDGIVQPSWARIVKLVMKINIDVGK